MLLIQQGGVSQARSVDRASVHDPFGCRSLYDMLREFAQEYVDLGRLLEQYINGPMAFVAPNLPVTTEGLADLLVGLEFIRDKCVQLNMRTSAGLVERARKDFQENRITYGYVKTRAEELERAFTLELRDHALMLIPDHRARWYVEHNDPLGAETILFGDIVCQNFPAAVPEFIEASMCYFAGRPTACINGSATIDHETARKRRFVAVEK